MKIKKNRHERVLIADEKVAFKCASASVKYMSARESHLRETEKDQSCKTFLLYQLIQLLHFDSRFTVANELAPKQIFYK